MGVAQYPHSNSGFVPRMFYNDSNIDFIRSSGERRDLIVHPLVKSLDYRELSS
jgi:hypothetical protein